MNDFTFKGDEFISSPLYFILIFFKEIVFLSELHLTPLFIIDQ